MTIIIAAICIWNEEQFIKSCIENIISKLQGISVIEILDGAWLPFSECYPLSTDKTEDIIIDLKEKYQKIKQPAWAEYKKNIEKLHKEQCGCTEWNGEEIVFPK
jgi:hypothetical protein